MILIWVEGGVIANRVSKKTCRCEIEVLLSFKYIKAQVRKHMCIYNASPEVMLVT